MLVVKNNLKSFMIHVFVVLLSIPVFYIGQNIDSNGLFFSMWLIVVLSLYFILGRRFLEKENYYKNITGTSIVAIVGIVITVILSIFSGSMGWSWFYFNLIYFPYVLPFIEWTPLGQQGKELQTFFTYFSISLIPSLTMYFGLKSR